MERIEWDFVLTYLSCLSLHTATITSKFPRMAMSMTAEIKVSSAIFSATLNLSLELETTNRMCIRAE